MRITIDTVQKKVIVEEDVAFDELYKFLRDKGFEKFTLYQAKHDEVIPTYPVSPYPYTYPDQWMNPYWDWRGRYIVTFGNGTSLGNSAVFTNDAIGCQVNTSFSGVVANYTNLKS